jgi:short subunit dehydrogenase-like uncharacterized protein
MIAIYGAYGFTGELLAREAVARGHRPLLLGRRREPLEALARELDADFRVASLDDARALREALDGVTAVIHAAGPFIETSPPMVAVCLDAGVHYLDVTGEVPVFEAVYELDGRAREAGVILLPGVGFDVVPSDGLAGLLHRALPEATALDLAILSSGALSPGTAETVVEHLPGGLLVRRGGRLRPARPGARGFLRQADFGPGPGGGLRPVLPYTWGDLSSAWRSTRIPDITCYMASSRRAVRTLPLVLPLLRLLLAIPPIRKGARAWARRRAKGPSPEVQERGRTRIRGRILGPEGEEVTALLELPQAYRFTAMAGIRAAEEVLARTGADAPDPLAGALTPSMAFGSEWVLGFPGVELLEAPGPLRKP